MKRSDIKSIIREILIESGELLITPLNFKKINEYKYEFDVMINADIVQVTTKFENLNEDDEIKNGLVPDFYKSSDNTYTINFTVGGDITQYKKTVGGVWLRVLTTVVTIILDFIKNKNPDVLVYTPAEKNNVTKSKTSSYREYLKTQIKQFPQYTYEEHDIYTIIYKKY